MRDATGLPFLNYHQQLQQHMFDTVHQKSNQAKRKHMLVLHNINDYFIFVTEAFEMNV